jgi:hypothetical protein
MRKLRLRGLDNLLKIRPVVNDKIVGKPRPVCLLYQFSLFLNNNPPRIIVMFTVEN